MITIYDITLTFLGFTNVFACSNTKSAEIEQPDVFNTVPEKMYTACATVPYGQLAQVVTTKIIFPLIIVTLTIIFSVKGVRFLVKKYRHK